MDRQRENIFEKIFMRIRVAIVEADRHLPNSLSNLLQTCKGKVEVVGSFTTAKKAIEGLQRDQPDVVLVDLIPPETSWIKVIKDVKNIFPSLKILVITLCEDRYHLFQALKAGASGYLLKEMSPEEIFEAIEEMNDGGSPMSSKIARYVIEYFLEKEGETNTRIPVLTKREQEILKGISDGLTYKQLADKFCISRHTARTHIRNIYEKLHVRCKIEAVKKGKEGGMF